MPTQRRTPRRQLRGIPILCLRCFIWQLVVGDYELEEAAAFLAVWDLVRVQGCGDTLAPCRQHTTLAPASSRCRLAVAPKYGGSM